MTRQFAVGGMACGGCEENVEDAVDALDGVTRVEADNEGNSVEIVADEGVADEAIQAAIEDAGYEVTS